jgi:hypothetical protein
MSLFRLVLLRSLRRSSATSSLNAQTLTLTPLLNHLQNPNTEYQTTSTRGFALLSAEEAGKLPLSRFHPDWSSERVGLWWKLDDSVNSLIRSGDLDAASAVACYSVLSNIRPTVSTCNKIIVAMYSATRYMCVLCVCGDCGVLHIKA